MQFAISRKLDLLCEGPQLISLRNDLNFAALTVANAFSSYAAAFVQKHVDYTAIRRCHGLQRDAAAGLGHPGRHPVGHFPQGIFPSLPVLLHVQRHSNVLVQLLTNDALYDKLQRLQGVASPPDEQPGIRAVDVNYRPPGRVIVFCPQRNVHVGSHHIQNSLHGLHGQSGGRIRRRSSCRPAGIRGCSVGFRFSLRLIVTFGARICNQERYADFCQFTANAQKSLTSPT